VFNFSDADPQNNGEEHNLIAESMRKKSYFENLEPFQVEDLNLFPKSDQHPILFEDIYYAPKKVGSFFQK